MSRRLLGYVVKLPDGTRSPLTPEPVKLYEAEVIWDKTPLDAGDWVAPVFAVRKPKPAEPEPAPLPPNPPCFCCGVGVEPGPCDDGFTDGERVACGHCGATNYPTVADDGTVEMSDGAEDEGDETKPAPVVAAEGRYALLVKSGSSPRGRFMGLDCVRTETKPRDVGTQAEATSASVGFFDAEVVRILPDGAHEAAIAAAREEGRREGASQALTASRARLEYWLDLWRHRVRAPEYPGDDAASGAKIEAYEQAILTIDEVAKGAAK